MLDYLGIFKELNAKKIKYIVVGGLIDTPVDYRQARKNIEYVRVRNINIPTIAINDLIKMKQKANRLQDERDIINLKKVKNERKKNRF